MPTAETVSTRLTVLVATAACDTHHAYRQV
ncbi:hypothetical protein N601_26105 [Rhodococcus erythropolis DN1]|nr:hypothetical protein N601_26105 [Rhodococcus erythropolis DN1]